MAKQMTVARMVDLEFRYRDYPDVQELVAALREVRKPKAKAAQIDSERLRNVCRKSCTYCGRRCHEGRQLKARAAEKEKVVTVTVGVYGKDESNSQSKTSPEGQGEVQAASRATSGENGECSPEEAETKRKAVSPIGVPDGGRETKAASKLTCKDCPAPYGEDGWCDVVIPDEIWNAIAPDCGVLCFRCMTKRLEKAGYEYPNLVPVIVASGPYKDANEEWRLIGLRHGEDLATEELAALRSQAEAQQREIERHVGWRKTYAETLDAQAAEIEALKVEVTEHRRHRAFLAKSATESMNSAARAERRYLDRIRRIREAVAELKGQSENPNPDRFDYGLEQGINEALAAVVGLNRAGKRQLKALLVRQHRERMLTSLAETHDAFDDVPALAAHYGVEQKVILARLLGGQSWYLMELENLFSSDL